MYSSNLKVDCDFRTIELLQMSISLKMCYVIITCNEVFNAVTAYAFHFVLFSCMSVIMYSSSEWCSDHD